MTLPALPGQVGPSHKGLNAAHTSWLNQTGLTAHFISTGQSFSGGTVLGSDTWNVELKPNTVTQKWETYMLDTDYEATRRIWST